MGKVNSVLDMLYLSGYIPEFIQDFDGYSQVSKMLTAHSYMINSSIYDLIIDYFTKNIFVKEGDSCYADIQSMCTAYVSMPFLTYQEAGYSDIGCEYRDYDSIKKHLYKV